MSGTVGKREFRWRLWQQLPLVVALVVLWLLLWGSVTLLNVVGGVLIAIAVTTIFYLPAVELSGRFNPFWFVVFLARFFASIFTASFQVAFQAIGPRGIRSNAIVRIQLDTRSDLMLTLTAMTVSLVPGSVAFEVDRENSVLFVHALGTRSVEDVEEVRADALRIERSLVLALGSKEDLRRLR